MRATTADRRLFLDVRGAPDAPPLLYLHGGPGMGCHEFMLWQGDRLAADLRVIGLDRRGPLETDPLAPDEPLDESDLVADCESLRASLGLERWAVLGHSFGGRFALRYAHQHPEAISAVIFENPGWDMAEAERLRLPAAAGLFEELGDAVSAARCRQLATEDLTDRWEARSVVAALGDRYVDLYVHKPEARVELTRTLADNPVPTDQRDRADEYGHRLPDAPDVMASMVPLLAGLSVPALLIKGRYDLTTGPEQIDGFRRHVPTGRIEVFDSSAHFAQFEEPDRYATSVRGFVLAHR
ncbi:alpha/beta fold hydrolase [Actinocatenispora rupis]|uniref:Proline iminopeptidase n=1 Tax=Actinocatenispora rupis TaxID=519421 RepID=A0A8J3NEB9_9ACTN|nr:alpha/beta hydrolase [Actinocatenispora rupis]GID13805.1 proline iminopeptidase [Actinocatenispora rupis]